MDNLAILPVGDYGFWQYSRNKELFKILSIFSPYCWLYECDMFACNRSLVLSDTSIYETVLDVVNINDHPYSIAETVLDDQLISNAEELRVTAQLRVLWHKYKYRGRLGLSSKRNRIEAQFQSSLSKDQENYLLSSLKTLSNLANNGVKL